MERLPAWERKAKVSRGFPVKEEEWIELELKERVIWKL